MADKPILNQAAINAATAAQAAATSKAEAAKAAGAPIVAKALPVIKNSSTAVSGLAAALAGNDQNAINAAITNAKNALTSGKAAITPEEMALGKQAATDYTTYSNQAANINIPGAIYDNTTDTSAGQSAYDTLLAEFTKYGLGSMVEEIKGLIKDNLSPSGMALALQNTATYQKRFSANADRIAKGLAALSPAEYIAMEDQYQNIMRNYGLPASYYSKDTIGTQAGFNQLLGNDVSAAELEDRVMTAQNRVQNANPEVAKALKAFYPDITNGDILAYALDPTKALDMIKRKVTAAEIGGAALSQGLTTAAQSAEDLARYGVTAAQAQQGYQQIAGMLPRGSQLADIYKQDPYTQAVAESDVFGTAGSAAAANKRKKLTSLETASFSGSSGAASNALSRDRSSSQMQYRESGAGAF